MHAGHQDRVQHEVCVVVSLLAISPTPSIPWTLDTVLYLDECMDINHDHSTTGGIIQLYINTTLRSTREDVLRVFIRRS